MIAQPCLSAIRIAAAAGAVVARVLVVRDQAVVPAMAEVRDRVVVLDPVVALLVLVVVQNRVGALVMAPMGRRVSMGRRVAMGRRQTAPLEGMATVVSRIALTMAYTIQTSPICATTGVDVVVYLDITVMTKEIVTMNLVRKREMNAFTPVTPWSIATNYVTKARVVVMISSITTMMNSAKAQVDAGPVQHTWRLFLFCCHYLRSQCALLYPR